jgi:hypothetical protein
LTIYGNEQRGAEKVVVVTRDEDQAPAAPATGLATA